MAGAECAAQVAAACLGCSSVLPECLKLARCCTRLAFVLSELGLAMREQEELRGMGSGLGGAVGASGGRALRALSRSPPF